jgi:hypothetical protein
MEGPEPNDIRKCVCAGRPSARATWYNQTLVLTLQQSFQKVPVPEFDHPHQLSRQINAPAPLALRGRVLAAHVIVLHNDEAIRILLVLPKLEVLLHCDELAAAKARAQCSLGENPSERGEGSMFPFTSLTDQGSIQSANAHPQSVALVAARQR